MIGPPRPELAAALAKFEEQFTYPLGPDQVFRISHGEDYSRFFRAIGRSACFVAEQDGRILGTLGTALRPLLAPDGTEQQSVYVGDLKVLPSARGGGTLSELLLAAFRTWQAEADSAYCVVMDGTRAVPTSYAPAFEELGHIVVHRIPTSGSTPSEDHTTDVMGCYRRWALGRYVGQATHPFERSESTPAPLVLTDGSACGLLEDTLRAKILLSDAGEMHGAHLSDFVYRSPADAARLAQVALRLAAQRGFPALFAAVSADEAAAFRARLQVDGVVAAPATVYGMGLEPGVSWAVNTSEI